MNRRHDPDVRLYDAACDLLLAARWLRETAHTIDTGIAIAPTLGCIQAGLQEIERAIAAMPASTPRGNADAAERLRCALAHAAATLRLADHAADAARVVAAEAAVDRSLSPRGARSVRSRR